MGKIGCVYTCPIQEEDSKSIAQSSCSNKLRELPACYKIKLRTLGYRLVYQVHDERIVVLVIAIGKRENSEVYNDAEKRV